MGGLFRAHGNWTEAVAGNWSQLDLASLEGRLRGLLITFIRIILIIMIIMIIMMIMIMIIMMLKIIIMILELIIAAGSPLSRGAPQRPTNNICIIIMIT